MYSYLWPVGENNIYRQFNLEFSELWQTKLDWGSITIFIFWWLRCWSPPPFSQLYIIVILHSIVNTALHLLLFTRAKEWNNISAHFFRMKITCDRNEKLYTLIKTEVYSFGITKLYPLRNSTNQTFHARYRSKLLPWCSISFPMMPHFLPMMPLSPTLLCLCLDFWYAVIHGILHKWRCHAEVIKNT